MAIGTAGSKNCFQNVMPRSGSPNQSRSGFDYCHAPYRSVGGIAGRSDPMPRESNENSISLSSTYSSLACACKSINHQSDCVTRYRCGSALKLERLGVDGGLEAVGVRHRWSREKSQAGGGGFVLLGVLGPSRPRQWPRRVLK